LKESIKEKKALKRKRQELEEGAGKEEAGAMPAS
jgi:hypothetical protein